MNEKNEATIHKPLDVAIFPEDRRRVEYAMIGLHGRNANKHAFFPFVRQMGFLHTRWFLPSAPFASENAPDIRRWFDKENDNSDEIALSRELIAELIDARRTEGIPAENIFLAGFSQGAVMAIDTALRYHARLGGVLSLSGYVAHPELLESDRHEANERIPIFMAHGIHDAILPIEAGRKSRDTLLSLGYKIDYREYEAAHRISSAEVRDIRAFLHRHMYGMEINDARLPDDRTAPF
jgi:phospholipase/carboxylesterase